MPQRVADILERAESPSDQHLSELASLPTTLLDDVSEGLVVDVAATLQLARELEGVRRVGRPRDSPRLEEDVNLSLRRRDDELTAPLARGLDRQHLDRRRGPGSGDRFVTTHERLPYCMMQGHGHARRADLQPPHVREHYRFHAARDPVPRDRVHLRARDSFLGDSWMFTGGARPFPRGSAAVGVDTQVHDLRRSRNPCAARRSGARGGSTFRLVTARQVVRASRACVTTFAPRLSRRRSS